MLHGVCIVGSHWRAILWFLGSHLEISWYNTHRPCMEHVDFERHKDRGSVKTKEWPEAQIVPDRVDLAILHKFSGQHLPGSEVCRNVVL